MKKLVLFCLSLFLPGLLFAQQASREVLCDRCVEGLRAAASIYSISTDSQLRSFLSTYFSMNAEQRKAYRDDAKTSAGLKLLIDKIPVGFNLEDANSTGSEQYKHLQQLFQQNQTIYQSDYVTIYSRIVPQSAIDGFQRCMADCIKAASAPQGLAYSLEGDVQGEFQLVINWCPTNGFNSTSVSDFRYSNVRPGNGESIRKGAPFVGFTPLLQSFERTHPKKPASITVSFKGLGEPVKITIPPKEETPANATGLPIGTIVASVLDYSQFTGQQVFDDTKSTWAPADGRAVAGSKYGKKFNPILPDLRGQFLRGFNQFYAPGEPPEVVNGKGDTVRNRISKYSYQTQQIQQHAHTINDPGYTYGIPVGENPDRNGRHRLAFAGDGGDTKLFPSTKQPLGISGTNKYPETEAETRPNNIAVYYYIKIN